MSYYTNKVCYICKQRGHVSRYCPVEKKNSKSRKLQMGKNVEYWIEHNFNCPVCTNKTLFVLGDNTPSLDIKCKNCSQFLLEVKSKCLSVKNLPTNIYLPHGKYSNYVNMVNKGLNMVIVIYGVNRKLKSFYYRKVLYIPNDILRKNDINLFHVSKTNDGLSKIYIKNLKKMPQWNFIDKQFHQLNNSIPT